MFPLIPEELGIHPLLLAALHAMVFLVGSDDDVVNGEAAEEAAQYLVTYLQRLQGAETAPGARGYNLPGSLRPQGRLAEQDVQFLENFLTEFGVGNSRT